MEFSHATVLQAREATRPTVTKTRKPTTNESSIAFSFFLGASFLSDPKMGVPVEMP